MRERTPAIAAAAAQIVALIHSRPRSPRQGEIEAIIAGVITSTEALQSAPLPPEAVEFIRVAQAFHHMCDQEDMNAPDYDERLREQDALGNRVHAAARTILLKPPRLSADILARACIVAHYNGHDLAALNDACQEADMGRWASEDLALAILKGNAWPVASALNSVLQSGGCHHG